MPSTLHAIWAALVALLFWTAIGYPVLRRCFPHATALPFAPIAGWAMHGVVALPIFDAVPLVRTNIVGVGIVALVVAWSVARFEPFEDEPSVGDARVVIPRAAWVGALIVAALCAIAILPKTVGDSVFLTDAVFDHSKVSMIDEMARSGLPPINPYIEHDGASGHLVYYYLLHFSAAELVRVLGVTGWEADVAMTFFAAFTSLAAMMGIAVRYTGRAGASGWVVVLALSASMRTVLVDLWGSHDVDRWVLPAGGFQTWFFQSAWVPQHLAGTTCVLLSLLLTVQLAARPAVIPALVLGLVVTAGFETSTWVGGLTFAACAALVVPLLVRRTPPPRRTWFVAALAAAAVLAMLFAWPFLLDQAEASAARGARFPIAVEFQRVLGDAVSDGWRRLLDPAAFWLLMLPIESAAIYLVGVAGVRVAWRERAHVSTEGGLLTALLGALVAALAVAWLLVSTLAVNNDLAWRAMLLASTLLVVFGSIALSSWVERRRWMLVALAAIPLLLGLPETVNQVRRNVFGTERRDSRAFADAPALWERVRALTAIDERVANNPEGLASLTPWSINLSWSMLSDRRSCYATWELTQVFSSIPHDRLRKIDALFVDVFAGRGNADDVAALANVYDCAVVVVTPQDGAWRADPFRDSRWYRLVDERPDRWRLYRREPASSTPPASGPNR